MSRSSKFAIGSSMKYLAYSDVHKGCPCTPCVLCGHVGQARYTHPKLWKDGAAFQLLQTLELSKAHQLDSCICKLCREDIPKASHNIRIPRWRKTATSFVMGCLSAANLKLGNMHDLREVFHSMILDETRSPLSMDHYRKLYKQRNPAPRCTTCSRNLFHSACNIP